MSSNPASTYALFDGLNHIQLPDDRSWRLLAPKAPEPAPAPVPRDVSTPTLQGATLRFEVSRDEEHAQLTVVCGDREFPLAPRVYHYLLLTLARERLRDLADPTIADAGQGWIGHARLARMLRIEEPQVNLQVHRARRQLAAAGFEDAVQLVERRTGARQLRIGAAEIEIRVI